MIAKIFFRFQFKSPEVNLNELYLFHIKTELEQEKLKHSLDILKSQITERKEQILVSWEKCFLIVNYACIMVKHS